MCSVAVLSPGPSLTFNHRVNIRVSLMLREGSPRFYARGDFKEGPGLWTLTPPAAATPFDFVPPSGKGISGELGNILQERSLI